MTKPPAIKRCFQSVAALGKGTADWLRGLCLAILGATSLAAQQGEEIGPALVRHYYSQPHLGTVVQIAFYASDKEQSQVLAEECFERVKKLNHTFSDYLPDSEVSQLCMKPAKVAYEVSDDLFRVMAQALEISNASAGAFDITLGHATRNWRESARQKKLLPEGGVNQVTFKDVILNSETKTILLRQPLKIDLGGIAKGYIADQLMGILKENGIRQAAVIIGGEMVFTEAPPGKEGWKVGVERPSHENLGVLTVSHTALSTSGDSYQFFELEGVRHAHLIDPSSGKSKTNRLNVTTLARSAILADAWATALRVSTMENALKLANGTEGLEAAFIPLEKPATFTAGFPKLEKP